jgi:hypothetical protein
VDLKRFEDAADMLCDMATLQGLAHLVLEEKAAHFRMPANRSFFSTAKKNKTSLHCIV